MRETIEGYMRLFDPRLRLAARDAIQLEGAFKRFVTYELPRRLELEQVTGPEGRIPPQRPRIEVPTSGVRTIIRFVSYGARTVVVRVYPLQYRAEAESHRRASTTLQKHGINVPRLIVFVDEPKRFGALFLVEEFLNLSRPETLHPEHVISLAGQLSRLHSVHNPSAGPLDKPSGSGFFTGLMRRVKRSLSAAVSDDVTSRSEAAMTLKWYQSAENHFRQVPHYSLTHGKLHEDNGLFNNDNEFVLLDFTTLEWAVPLKDVVLVRRSILKNQPELVTTFETHYLGALNDVDRTIHNRLFRFYEAHYLLSQVATNTKRMERGKKRSNEGISKRRSAQWAEMMAIVSQGPP